ncbi:MAG: hypothetical protein WHX93_14895 [bacterium]
MLVYGIRWGWGSLLGFAMGGIQWKGAPSTSPEMPNRDARAGVLAQNPLGKGMCARSSQEHCKQILPPEKAQEASQDVYDFRGRAGPLFFEPRGLLVDIRI